MYLFPTFCNIIFCEIKHLILTKFSLRSYLRPIPIELGFTSTELQYTPHAPSAHNPYTRLYPINYICKKCDYTLLEDLTDDAIAYSSV